MNILKKYLELRNVPREAKVFNICASLLMCIVGVLFVANPGITIFWQRVIIICLCVIWGAVKIIGYYSNDLYRLAFQFGLAVGIFAEILAVFTVVGIKYPTFTNIPVIIGIYVIFDGLLKIQIGIDAKRFGIKRWRMIIIVGILLALCGILLVGNVNFNIVPISDALGAALLAAGIASILVTTHTVKIGTRKSELEKLLEEIS